MTASRPRASRAALAGALALLALAGCRTTGAPPESPVELLARRAAIVPESEDYAAADVAAAALAGRQTQAAVALVRLESIEAVRVEDGGEPSQLVPWAQDVVNAAARDMRDYRVRARELLEQDDLDPALRARLERAVRNDPLALADQRMADARRISFGRAFNALVAPLSRAYASIYGAGVGLVRGVVGLAVTEHQEEALTRPERQALAHWKQFLEENPDAPEAAGVVRAVQESQARWNQVQRDRALRGARQALESDQPRVALVQAQRALRYAEEDGEASALLEIASTRLQRQREQAQASLAADPDQPPDAVAPPQGLDLATALLDPDGDILGEARRLRAADGPLADEADFARALVQAEAGEESAGWETLEDLAERDPARANMARHARALLKSPEQNPAWAFRETRSHDRWRRVRWVMLGPLMDGARERDLPRFVEWLVDLPALLEGIGSFPNRLVAYPWLSPWPFGRSPAAYGRMYLERHPDGEHANEVREWLLGYEQRRGNQVAALELARALGRDEDELAEREEKAGEQILEAADRMPRRDVRVHLYQEITRNYAGTRASRQAAARLREVSQEATPQQIRISRGFLRENPRVAGPQGLGLQPGLLDEDLANGELHEQGVTLVGGRLIDFAFVPESGRQDDAPEMVRRRVSAERLARLVALLDETQLRNALVDSDDRYGLDADRERYFERARLGLTEQPDLRPTAHSSYAYRGMRERYGLVRSRESILPVELVVQGSLTSLSLGAFPRVRMPKPTPDAPLFE